MATEVDICNLALSKLGDEANLHSIDPPDGSTQADHCARWYPIARDKALQCFPWSFATRRVEPAKLMESTADGLNAFDLPAKCLRVLSVHDKALSRLGSIIRGFETDSRHGVAHGDAQESKRDRLSVGKHHCSIHLAADRHVDVLSALCRRFGLSARI